MEVLQQAEGRGRERKAKERELVGIDSMLYDIVREPQLYLPAYAIRRCGSVHDGHRERGWIS